MSKRLLLILIILLFSGSFAFAEFSKGDLTIAGYFKDELSLDLKSLDEVSKFKNILQLSGEYKLSDDWVFFTSARYWFDSIYDLRDKYEPAKHYMEHTQRTDWLRDCYLDYVSGHWFLRLGKQQVSWGQSDGIAVLDRVNPVDLTEFWLPDAVDLRIPLWMANINYSPKLNSNLQLLIIPDFEQSTAAPPPAPFAFRSYSLFMAFKDLWESPVEIPGVLPPAALRGDVNVDIYYPAKQFKNSKFGIQWQDRIRDWNYTLNYLYGYDYLARTYAENPDLIPPLDVNYGRRFKLVQMAGGSLNHTFTEDGLLKGVTLRADAAVYLNEPTYYGTVATGKSEGVNRWNNVFWLIGLDKSIVTNWLASFQFAQYIMEHAKPGGGYQTLNSYTYGAQDQVENIFSLKISTDFLHEKLKSEILWSCTDDNQGRISPKATYEINDNLWFTLGIHYFYGKEVESNGQFRDVSQFYTQIKYTF